MNTPLRPPKPTRQRERRDGLIWLVLLALLMAILPVGCIAQVALRLVMPDEAPFKNVGAAANLGVYAPFTGDVSYAALDPNAPSYQETEQARRDRLTPIAMSGAVTVAAVAQVAPPPTLTSQPLPQLSVTAIVGSTDVAGGVVPLPTDTVTALPTTTPSRTPPAALTVTATAPTAALPITATPVRGTPTAALPSPTLPVRVTLTATMPTLPSPTSSLPTAVSTSPATSTPTPPLVPPPTSPPTPTRVPTKPPAPPPSTVVPPTPSNTATTVPPTPSNTATAVLPTPSNTATAVPPTPSNTATAMPVLPVLSIASAQMLEGDSGTTMLSFTVSLSVNAPGPISVNYTTMPTLGSNTATAGSDYLATTGSLNFAPGDLQQTITVPILGDRFFEPDESFLVWLAGANGATVGIPFAIGTITNDDSRPTVSIAPDATSVNEGK